MNSIDPPIDRGAFRRRSHRRPPFGPDATPSPFARPGDEEGFAGGPRLRGRRGPRGGPGDGPGDGPDFGPRGFGPRGFGPGFGPGGPGAFRGPRRGRRTPRGDIRAAVLALVAEQPRHGYELIQEIAQRSGGIWRPSPGSVYPTISQLEDEGLVRVEQADGRRVVHLTDAGMAWVTEHRAELDAVWTAVGNDTDTATVALWEQLTALQAATHQVMTAGSPEQVGQATEALTQARKTIYRLLAE